ncbi:hypothetical protein ACVBEQ_26750 [Nakamurella sp. GG22]
MNSRTPPGWVMAAALTAVLLAGTAACAAPADPPTTSAPTVRLAITPTGTAPASPISASAPESAAVAAAEPDDADEVVEKLAVDWLVAYRTASYALPADAWINRTAPYVTPQLTQQNNQLRDGGRGPGIAWQDFTQRRCTARVLDPAAVIPPEAPHTPDNVRVQAAGTLRTTCATGTDPPDEALAVTLTAVRTTAGWRIASRDY